MFIHLLTSTGPHNKDNFRFYYSCGDHKPVHTLLPIYLNEDTTDMKQKLLNL